MNAAEYRAPPRGIRASIGAGSASVSERRGAVDHRLGLLGPSHADHRHHIVPLAATQAMANWATVASLSAAIFSKPATRAAL